MALRLFVDAMSQPSRSVMILLKCANVAHTIVVTDIMKGANREEDYLKKNPTGRVPSIEDRDGSYLFESAAIMKYVCETRALADHWYPKDIMVRSKIDEYMSWHHTNLRLGAAFTFRELFLIPKMTGKPPDEVVAEKYKQIFHECMKVFDKHFLANTKFISSDEISIADLLAVTEFSQLEVLGNQAPQISQKVKDWIERCKEATEPHYSDVHKILYKVKAKNLGSKL